MTDRPRFFELHRDTDISGVSGTGKVAEGAIFSDGAAVIHWTGHQYPTTTPHPGGLAWTEGIHCHHGTTLQPLDDPRLARIAEAHSKSTGVGGTTDGLCSECDLPYPCPTYVWATTDRNPLATWDPADDEPESEPCPAGLLPKGDAPAERCIVDGDHTTHVAATGRRWQDGEQQ